MKTLLMTIISLVLASHEASATITLDTDIINCSASTGPCRAISNPNKQKILLVNAESITEGCSYSHSDSDVFVRGGSHCSGTFKVWVLWDAYIYERDYRITYEPIPVKDGPQWVGTWISIGEAAPNSRKVHGVALESMDGECTWHHDNKKLTVMKKSGYTGACEGTFKVLTGPAY